MDAGAEDFLRDLDLGIGKLGEAEIGLHRQSPA
jgi:hypothetical protein